MIVILEGPDGGGKTALAEELERRFTEQGSTVYRHHHGPYPGLSHKQLCLRYAATLALRGPDAVTLLDRSWLSEPIYGAAFRGGADRVGPEGARVLARMATCGRPAVVIVAHPGVKMCLATWRTRPEYLERSEQLVAVCADYERLTDRGAGLPLLSYDFMRHSIDELWSMLVVLRESHPSTVGAGSWEPRRRVLLIGERTNARGSSTLKLTPFAGFDGSGCGAWLCRQLDLAKASELDLYWINAQRPDGRWEDGLDVEALAPRYVVALGNVARTWCRAYDLEHLHVPHPQYWKRFHHQQPYELVPALRAALSNK